MMHRILCVFLALGLSASALAINEPPTTAPDLRNGYASLRAVPGVPDGFKVDFNDAQVLLRSITVEPTSGPATGGCRVLVRINNLLAKVLIVEPPVAVQIVEPPSNSPAVTWKALQERFGIDQPPSGIVFTPNDGLTITLESLSSDSKVAACSANVLVLGSVFTEAHAAQVTPISPADLRSEFVSLKAVPDAPGYQKYNLNDVLITSYDVIPTQTSPAVKCVLSSRINELLASIRINEPPDAIVGITEPPDAIDGVTLAGITEPPVGIVFTPNDSLELVLESVPTGKAKDKDNTCAADVLILGTAQSDGA